MKRILCVAVAIALSGCATSVVPTHEASPGTLLTAAIAQPSPGTMPIVFKRDTGFMGAGCTHRVFLNGEPVADLRVAQAVSVYVKPAIYIVGVRSTGICGGGDSELEIDLKDGRPRTYRISSDQGGSLRIQPSAF